MEALKAFMFAWPAYATGMTVLYALVICNPKRWFQHYLAWAGFLAFFNILVPGLFVLLILVAATMNAAHMVPLWLIGTATGLFGPLAMFWLGTRYYRKKQRILAFTIMYAPYFVLTLAHLWLFWKKLT